MTSLITVIPTTSTYKTSLTTQSPTQNAQMSEQTDKTDKKRENVVKTATITGSVLTTLAYLLVLGKSVKKGDFKFIDMFKQEFENMFKVMGLATSALVGGLAGGLLADDKKNTKPKLKEGVHQFLGNIITPISIVGVLTNAINKKNYAKTKSIMLSGLACIAGVCGGVTGGNWIATKVNNKLFNEHDDRKLHVKDFGIHIDDLMTVATLSDTIRDWIKPIISWALPAIFLICGYEAGTKNINSKE